MSQCGALSVQGYCRLSWQQLDKYLSLSNFELDLSLSINVSDISLNVQENGHALTPSKMHCVLKSGVSDELKKRVLAIRPDDVVAGEQPWVTSTADAVKIRIGESGVSAKKPITLHTMLATTVERSPQAVALGYKRDGVWIELNYMEYFESILKTAKAFLKLGLDVGGGVGILGFNSLEWFLSYMGAIYCSGVAVGVYTTNSAESCQFVLDDSRCNIVVVENTAQLKKILKVKSQLKHLKAIIQWTGELEVDDPMVYKWSTFQNLGDDVADDLLVGRVKAMAPNKCAGLIYTSGTTGSPKGAMISHDNLTWASERIVEDYNIGIACESIVTYLPLSHIAAQLLDITIPLYCGAAVYFAQPDALKGSLAVTLREIRPTVFFAVPRVWEKFMEKMQALGAQSGGMKKAIAGWAKSIGLRGNRSIRDGSENGRSRKRGSTPWGWSLANVLVFNKVRQNLGLDRCRYLLSGAAPISQDTMDYFLSLNLPIYEIYGMSESTGPHTFTMPGKVKAGSCGAHMSGASTIITDPDDEGNGEICMSGRHVFMGYLNNDEKTREAVDDDGLLHTGDIGRLDKDGFLFITGRIKELLITAGGENVAPVPIEDVVKAELPCISNCMLIGDRKKFLAMMLTFKTNADADGNPLDTLTKQTASWCRSVGCDATTVSEIIKANNPGITKAIQAGIDRANARAVSRAQVIQKWSILPQDFSVGGGELGPTMKLRRPIVTKMYEKEIEKFYADAD